jgi:hypothetical protein
VRFLVNQIGKSNKAEEFLNELANDTRLDDVVHVTSGKLGITNCQGEAAD